MRIVCIGNNLANFNMLSCSMAKPSKKWIAIISGISAAAVTGIYVLGANNPMLTVLIPAILTFAICPAMCAAMGGAMWLFGRSKKNKVQTVLADNNTY